MPAKYQGTETIEGKTVLITGANTGIGKETARELAKRGGRIILACRNVEKGEEARKEIVEETKNEDVVVQELDLSSFESIQKFAKNFNENEIRLDILINNAGVMACPKMLTKDGLEMQIGTNHFGHFMLTNLLLNKLKACSPSRIINLSSLAHSMGTIKWDDINSEKNYGEWAAYGQSKLANILHCLELTNRLKGEL
ncbi:retinol dehydrogenase 12 [Elysia marginata]|uniref:Retinol dehydrogenase 12 n=1 Tax=Elysia marginata TaxID=1093978 RepID=A0AAV4GDA1_9GAST|nr:retinol dehydrogenase 12 [Elysia marginata]